jgi:hypothetical protein
VNMRKAWLRLAFFMFSALLLAHGQLRYSTGGVSNYPAATCGGPNLPLSVPEARDFQAWYNLAGFVNVTRWENGDVWGSDFRDSTNGSNNDRDGSGGSDITQLYFFTGHGLCENPPRAGSGDFIVTCGNFGKPDVTRIGTSSRWGNNGGQLRFMFLDASCPMDLPEIQSEWFAPFQGLHVATGHSGDVNHDTQDSETRGDQYAAHTVGGFSFLGIRIILFPEMSIGDAWMATGLIDVQPQVCAVALAAGNDRNDAINRRENERVTSNWGNPTPNWFAWKWVCN